MQRQYSCNAAVPVTERTCRSLPVFSHEEPLLALGDGRCAVGGYEATLVCIHEASRRRPECYASNNYALWPIPSSIHLLYMMHVGLLGQGMFSFPRPKDVSNRGLLHACTTVTECVHYCKHYLVRGPHLGFPCPLSLSLAHSLIPSYTSLLCLLALLWRTYRGPHTQNPYISPYTLERWNHQRTQWQY